MNEKNHVASGTVDGTQTKTKRGDHIDSQIVAIFCDFDDILKALFQSDDYQRQMTDEEVTTITLMTLKSPEFLQQTMLS